LKAFLKLVPTNERRRKLAIAAVVVLAFPSLVFNGSAAADYAGPIHTDEQLRRLTDYQGPVRSDRILRAWREQFLGQRFNRAIAITGGWGTVWGRKTPEDAMDERVTKLPRCPENLIHECHLYAVNNAVVYPGNRQFTDKFSPCLIQFLDSSGRDGVCGTAGLAVRR
jgi:hypothetical protein